MALPNFTDDRGFTKFPNSLRRAPWRNKPKTVAVYFFLRINANHFENGFDNITIYPGEVVSGRARIAAETGLTEDEVRTAISHLKRSGHITSRSTNNYTVFSFTDKENWGDMADCIPSEIPSTFPSDSPANPQQIPSESPQIETEILETRENERRRPRKRFTPPTIEEASAYFAEKGESSSEAQRFFDYYTSNGWRVGKNPMKDWHAAASGWISRNRNACRLSSQSPAKGLHSVPTAREYSEGVDSSGFGWA